ncbi:MAG TPA: YbjQ family protein [Pyrinomonadaceae bacterium]|nr:YbjQ family protein [Pyrinomonadaceae bacterium]
MQRNIICASTESVAGNEIAEVLGVVTGNIVQSKHVGKDILASLKTIIGGEIGSYTELFTEARQKAISRMVSAARDLNADAVVNVRFTTSSIMSNASEILAYGTAVRFRR